MSSKASEVLAVIKDEAQRSKNVRDAFTRALCLFETHYLNRPSSLLEIFPELRGQSLTGAEVAEMNQALMRFIEDAPAHECVAAAIRLLALSKDKHMRRFFVHQLRQHAAWHTSAVVFQLLLALEDLGEEVFLDAQGQLIRSRSSNAFDVNLDLANRYLKEYDTHG